MDPRAAFHLPFPQRMMRVSMGAMRVWLLVYVVWCVCVCVCTLLLLLLLNANPMHMRVSRPPHLFTFWGFPTPSAEPSRARISAPRCWARAALVNFPIPIPSYPPSR